jgi:superfamily II DNA helicase RecQ
VKLKVFTFRFSESLDGFDDEPLQNFLSNKEIIEFHHHFFIHAKTPYLTVIIAYRDQTPKGTQKHARKPDPRQRLDDFEKETYDALRTWRAARAVQEGIPPYMIANNKQLAHMVRLKAASKSDLSRVSGIGDAKIEKYGEDILQTISRHMKPEPAETPSEDENTPS